jgi:Leucine-rich repeat (LRR) protein
MKFIILTLLLASTSNAQDVIDCVYSTFIVNNVQHYSCNLHIENPNGFDDYASIPGTHLDGRTDADVTYLMRYYGMTTNFPQVICSQFPNLQFVNFIDFGLTTLSDTSFGGCASLTDVELFNNSISSITPNAFVNNRNLSYVDLGLNQLRALPETLFASQEHLNILELISNPYEENFPAELFSALVNLRFLHINHCRQTAINPRWFANLRSLVTLNLHHNFFLEIPAGAFSGLVSLTIFNINDNFIQQVHGTAFESVESMQFLNMEANQIGELPSGVFAPFRAVSYVDLRWNRIKTVSRDAFGSVSSLSTLDLDANVVNALDERLFADATGLYFLFFGDNLCASGFFNNFIGNRAMFLQRLARCFRNFEFTVGEL